MGTRHLICIVADGEYKLAQYGQWDGYPSGQGIDILQFMRDPRDAAALRNNLKLIKVPTEEENKAIMLAAVGHFKDGACWLTVEASKEIARNQPGLSRDTGAKILKHIANATREVLTRDSIAFAGDSLFCEWAYVIDFDKAQLEVYRGFNKYPVPDGERFTGPKFKPQSVSTGGTYYAVKLAKVYPLEALPDDDTFCRDLT